MDALNNSDPKPAGRRRGRSARVAERAAPLAEEIKPVRPGVAGGRYRPLGDADVRAIHRSALELLETVGMGSPIPSCVEAVMALGGQLAPTGRLLFPSALVEDVLARAARHFTLHGQKPEHDLEPQGARVHFGTGGAAVHIVDPVSGDYRDSLIRDVYDSARLVDTLDHIHFYQRTVVARDLPDPFDLDFSTCFAAVTGTAKHVGTSFVQADHVEASLAMLHEIAGGEEAWRRRPFVSMSNCFVVPPLTFAEDACRCLEVAVRGGMPVLLLSAGQAGATAPAALAGAVTQAVAEVLAGLVYVNAIKPGAVAIFGTWPFVSDLRTGAMSGGSGEEALLMSACAQMAQFYDLTSGVSAGMTDSKLPDAQSGFEKGLNHALVANAGGNLIYEAAGMHASLLGFCHESLVMDNDSLGAALRTVRGIEVSEENLSLEVIRQVCLEGPGHYLGHEQTLRLMQRDYVYPTIADRLNPKEWAEIGAPDTIKKAFDWTREILATHYPDHVPRDVLERIRARWQVALPEAAMRASE